MKVKELIEALQAIDARGLGDLHLVLKDENGYYYMHGVEVSRSALSDIPVHVVVK